MHSSFSAQLFPLGVWQMSNCPLQTPEQHSPLDKQNWPALLKQTLPEQQPSQQSLPDAQVSPKEARQTPPGPEQHPDVQSPSELQGCPLAAPPD
jgi:hypothetical protein